MNRRDILKFLAATSTLNLGSALKAQTPMKVVVVGAGIVGSSIAYYLSKAGVSVEVIDRVGPASHASKATFAWINATWAKQPRSYHSFTQDSMIGWKALESELDIPIVWNGSLEWFSSAERTTRLAEQIEEQKQWNERASMVTGAALNELEPNVIFSDQAAAFSANDGAVDPVLAVSKLLEGAQAFGAKISFPTELLGVRQSNDRLSLDTTSGVINADKVILATGANSDAIQQFAGMTIPQRTTPGVITVTEPMPSLINRIIAAPGVHLHQRKDGRIVLGEQAGPPQTDAHDARLRGRPRNFPTEAFALEHGNRLIDYAKVFVPSIEGAKPEWSEIGWRPLPIDGHPVVGPSSENADVYIAIMHSGVTLAPLIGQLTAMEIVNNQSLAELANYRPNRDFESIRRY